VIYRDIIKAQLTVEEGRKAKMYLDTQGKWTIGIGHNLSDKPISQRAIDVIFEDDLADAERDARALFPSFDSLSENRKAVVVDMSLNLGINRLGAFAEMRRHVEGKEFDLAAAAMLDSLWARQVGDRAQHLAKMMKEG
jgi:lysozyme